MTKRRHRSLLRGGRNNQFHHSNIRGRPTNHRGEEYLREPEPDFRDGQPFRSPRSRSRELHHNIPPPRRSRSPQVDHHPHWSPQRNRSPGHLKQEGDIRPRAGPQQRRGRGNQRRDNAGPRREVGPRQENFRHSPEGRPRSPVIRRSPGHSPQFRGGRRPSAEREREGIEHPRQFRATIQAEDLHRPRSSRGRGISPLFRGHFSDKHVPQFQGQDIQLREEVYPGRVSPMQERERSPFRGLEHSPPFRGRGPSEPCGRGGVMRSPSPRERAGYEQRRSPIPRRRESPGYFEPFRVREEPLHSSRERALHDPPISNDAGFIRHENVRPPEFDYRIARHDERRRSPRRETDYGHRENRDFDDVPFHSREERNSMHYDKWVPNSRNDRPLIVDRNDEFYREEPPRYSREHPSPPRFVHEPPPGYRGDAPVPVPARRSASPAYQKSRRSPPRVISLVSPVRVDWDERGRPQGRDVPSRWTESRMEQPHRAPQQTRAASPRHEERRPGPWLDEPAPKRSAHRPSPRRDSPPRRISLPRCRSVDKSRSPHTRREPNPSSRRNSPQRGRKRSWSPSPPRREEIKEGSSRPQRRSRSPMRRSPGRRNRLITPPPPIIGSVSSDRHRSPNERTPPIVRIALGMRDKSPTLSGGIKQDVRGRRSRFEPRDDDKFQNGRSTQPRRRSVSPGRGSRRRSESPRRSSAAHAFERSPPRRGNNPMPPLQNLIRESELRGHQAREFRELEVEHLKKIDELQFRRALDYRDRLHSDPILLRAAIESREAEQRMERARIIQHEMDMRNRPALSMEAFRRDVVMGQFDRIPFGPPPLPVPAPRAGMLRPLLPTPMPHHMHSPAPMQPPPSQFMVPPPFRKF